jgi:hypothetical protein
LLFIRSNNGLSGNATSILNDVDEDSWWVDLVQALWRRNGKKIGILRQLVHLLAQIKDLRRQNPNNPHIEVILQYYNTF